MFTGNVEHPTRQIFDNFPIKNTTAQFSLSFTVIQHVNEEDRLTQYITFRVFILRRLMEGNNKDRIMVIE